MTGYPWTQGDPLLAADLNAAIANSIGLSSGTLPLNGSLPMTGPITLAGNATQPLHAVPLQQVTSAVAAAPFLPTAGGAMGGALSLSGNATQPLHAVPLQQLTSTVTAALPGINATDYGVIADGTTDNTAAMQAAINAAQATVPGGQCARLMLPQGRILTGPLSITNQIFIQGVHDNSTVLVLKTGSTAPCITINPSGAAFPVGTPRGRVVLQDLRIENQTGKTGDANAHGFQFAQSSAWTCHVTLQRVTVYGMPGSGITSLLFNGWVDCFDCSIFNNNLYGVTVNSCNDWHWYGGDVAVNGSAGVLLSGCSQFVFVATNIYSNGTYNLQLFSGGGAQNGNHQFTDCMFDRSNQVGMFYQMSGVGGALFQGCTFSGASQVTPNTYSDVLIGSGANNLAMFSGCWWGNNRASDAACTEKWALEFQGSTQTVVVDGTNTFAGGALRTNALGQVFFNNAGERLALQGGVSVVTAQQYTGLGISNGTNPIINISGFSGANDGGVLALLNGGVAGAQFSASNAWAANFINNPLYLGNGATSATPVAQSLNATGGSGTNIAGATLHFNGGASTGTAAGGGLMFWTTPASGSSSATANSAVNRLTIDTTGLATFANNVRVNGSVGFYNTAPVAKPTASGAKGSNAALASVIAGLVALGLFTDTTTA